MALYLIDPAGAPPCVRRRHSLAHAVRRALAEFPAGVADVRHVPPQALPGVLALGVSVAPRTRLEYAKVLKAKERKAARTVAALEKRRDARAAQVEARRVQAGIEKNARAVALRVAKAAATVAARKASKAASEATQKGAGESPGDAPQGVAEVCGWAPWEDGPAPAVRASPCTPSPA